MESVNVTAETYLELMTRVDAENPGVLQSIRAKVPWALTHETIIQHDGASGHEGKGNYELLHEAGQHNPIAPIKWETQSAQSPDVNKNDHCFFASLQAKADKLKLASKSKEVLMDAVTQAYAEYPAEALVRVDALQFEIYRCILKCDGSNQYDLPHSGIRKRQNEGSMVPDYTVPPGLVNKARMTVLELTRQLQEE